MNYARRKEILARARAAYPAPLSHSPWFTPPPKRFRIVLPTTSAYTDFLLTRALLCGAASIVDRAQPVPDGNASGALIRAVVARYFNVDPKTLIDRRVDQGTQYIWRLVVYFVSRHTGTRWGTARLLGCDPTTVRAALYHVYKGIDQGDAHMMCDIAALSRILKLPIQGRKKTIDPTPADVREWFSYEPETGVLRWRKKPRIRNLVGARAGVAKKGGWVVVFQGKSWEANRLAWIHAHGEIPGALRVRAVDGNRANCALANLKLVERRS